MKAVNNKWNPKGQALANALQQAAQHLHTQLDPLPEVMGHYARRLVLTLPELAHVQRLMEQTPSDVN